MYVLNLSIKVTGFIWITLLIIAYSDAEIHSKSQQLTCLCNENLNCINQHVDSSDKSMKGWIGYCHTSSGGHCYTARAINVQPLTHYLSTGRIFAQHKKNERQFRSSSTSNFNVSTDNFDHINADDFIQTTYGCITMAQEVTLLCNGNLPKHAVPQAIECCNSTDSCNSHLLPKFVHHKSDREAVISALLHLKSSKIQQSNMRRNRVPKFNPDMLKQSSNLNPNYSLPISQIANGFYFRKDKKDEGMSYIFYIILVITFSIVLIVLTLVLACVCLVYRRRLNKRRNLITSNYSDSAFSRHILPSQTLWNNHEWTDTVKHELLNGSLSRNMQKSIFNGTSNGSSSQTLSTDLTRNIGSVSTNRQRLSPALSVGNECLRLLPETIGKQVVFNEFLGRGRSSDVWKATWRGEPVLAKIFRSNNEFTQCIWRRMVHLHRSMLLRHQSIHGLMAVDWLDYPTSIHLASLKQQNVQLWHTSQSPCALLIGEFNLLGTLKELLTYSYLSSEAYRQTRNGQRLSWVSIPSSSAEARLRVMLSLATSLTQGLCFLHSEFSGTRGKPALAHRNLKPSNIYIRPDWSCCISDIGFAVRSPPGLLPLPLPNLHSIYKQEHSNYCESGLSASAHLIDPKPLEITSSQSKPVAPNFPSHINTCPWSTGNQQHHQRQHIKHSGSISVSQSSFSKPSLVDKFSDGKSQLGQLEQLDWWPIGGWHVGTPRYMAPELLDCSLNPFCIESHQKADIYALALILWELVTWALPLSIWPNRFPSQEANSSSRSSTDSMSLTNSGSSLAPKPSHDMDQRTQYWAAFQEEFSNMDWNKKKPNTRECQAEDSKLMEFDRSESTPLTASQQLLHGELEGKHDFKLGGEHRDMKPSCVTPNEPDVPAMHHLVCDLNLRPFVPNAMHRFAQDVKRSSSIWGRTTVAVTELKHASSSTLFGPLDPNRDPLQGLNTAKNVPLLGRESSSSGASSLNSAHTHPLGTSNDSLTHTTSSRIHQMQRLIATHFSTLLPECWAHQPDSRLTALRIKKSLQRISDQLARDATQKSNPDPSTIGTLSNSEHYKSACTGSSTLEGRSC